MIRGPLLRILNIYFRPKMNLMENMSIQSLGFTFDFILSSQFYNILFTPLNEVITTFIHVDGLLIIGLKTFMMIMTSHTQTESCLLQDFPSHYFVCMLHVEIYNPS